MSPSLPDDAEADLRRSLDVAEADYDQRGGVAWTDVRERIAQSLLDQDEADDV